MLSCVSTWMCDRLGIHGAVDLLLMVLFAKLDGWYSALFPTIGPFESQLWHWGKPRHHNLQNTHLSTVVLQQRIHGGSSAGEALPEKM